MPVTTLVVHEDVPLDSVGQYAGARRSLLKEGKAMNRIQISEGMGLDDFGLALDAADGDLGKMGWKKLKRIHRSGIGQKVGWRQYQPLPATLPGRRIGWRRYEPLMPAPAAPLPLMTPAVQGFEDDGSTPLVTIGEDVSLEDLAEMEHLEHLESLGQLGDLGKSKLKKLRKKLKKVVKKIAKPIKKVVKAVAKVVKKVVQISPLYIAMKAGKKLLMKKKKKKTASGEEVIVEEPATPQEEAAYYQQQAYGATAPSYGAPSAGGGAPSSAYWPVEEPAAEEGAPEEEAPAEEAPAEETPEEEAPEEAAKAPGLPSLAPKMLTTDQEGKPPAEGELKKDGVPITTYLLVAGGVLAVGAVVYFAFIRK